MNLPISIRIFSVLAAAFSPLLTAHADTLTFEDQSAIYASGFDFTDRLVSYLPTAAYSGGNFVELSGTERFNVISKSGEDFTANSFWIRTLGGNDTAIFEGYGSNTESSYILYYKRVEVTENWQLITLDFRNIKYLLTANSDWNGRIAGDNFTFNEAVGPNAPDPYPTPVYYPVPEPEMYAMLFVGLGLVGAYVRRMSRT